ncbi:MAG: N-acetylmuramoyl-L-alanine amidase [Thermomicrobiaceae bacterium]
MSTIKGVPFRIDFIPMGNSNRPGNAMTPERITVHDTGNPNHGANAEMHRRFVNGGGGPESVSWHYTVDDREIIQHLPLNEHGWHAGDGGNGSGNRRSIGIEVCVNADSDWATTMRNTAKLVAHLQEEFGYPDSCIVQHNHWSGKNCPARMRGNGGQGWREFLMMIPEEKSETILLQTEPCRYFEATGHNLCREFRAFWEEYGGLMIFGYPLSEQFVNEHGIAIQWFERACFEYQPDIAENVHGVTLGLIGVESRARDQEKFPDAFERQPEHETAESTLISLDSWIAVSEPNDVPARNIVEVCYRHGRVPQYDRAKIERIADAIVARSAEFGFRTSICAGQILHETGYFRFGGQVRPEQNNFAGLGATNDGAEGASFPTEDDGVLAVMCHLALYVYGDCAQWPERLRGYEDKAIRRDAVRWAHENRRKPNGELLGYLGTVDRISSLVNGRWAQTDSVPLGTLDNGYAGALVRISNEVLRA